MKGKTKNLLLLSEKYDYFILFIVMIAMIFMADVWLLYAQKNSQLENEIEKLKL